MAGNKYPAAPIRSLVTSLQVRPREVGSNASSSTAAKDLFFSMTSGKGCKNTVQGWLINCILLAILITSVYKLGCC